MIKSRPARLATAFLAAIIIVAIAVVGLLHKRVTLVIDGQSRSLSTFALTVGSLLNAENIAIGEDDELYPAVTSWLRNKDVITLNRAIPVEIYAQGSLHHLVSTERRPDILLASLGITLLSDDILLSEGVVLPPDQAMPGPVQSISLQIIHNIQFTLLQDTQSQTLSAATASLGQALWQADIKMQSHDRLQPAMNTPLSATSKAVLKHAQPITILTASGEISRTTAADTIGEALSEAGLSMQGLDYASPPADQPVPSDRRVRLVRVREEVIIENTPLAFETTYEADPNLELDSQSILQTGEYGLTAQRVRVRYEDGQEVSRQTDTEWVARQPKPRIVGYGTKVVKHALNTPDGTIYYYRALTMWATSYCPADVGGNTLTASGQTLRKGLVAINPYYIPYGTQMYVPGYGHAEAADTGLLGARWIDLGYSDEDYIAWHQNVTVYFLWPPPAQILWIYP